MTEKVNKIIFTLQDVNTNGEANRKINGLVTRYCVACLLNRDNNGRCPALNETELTFQPTMEGTPSAMIAILVLSPEDQISYDEFVTSANCRNDRRIAIELTQLKP
jgi:hypothetical protein